MEGSLVALWQAHLVQLQAKLEASEQRLLLLSKIWLVQERRIHQFDHLSMRFDIGVEGRNRLRTAEVNATLCESRICQILEYLQATHPEQLAMWIHLKWRCTIDTPLPDPVTIPLTHNQLQLQHVSQVELRATIRHIEVAIYANNPVQDIGHDFTYVFGHNTATRYVTSELNETIRQSVSLLDEISTLLDNPRELERLG
jgi:hypothetical protein